MKITPIDNNSIRIDLGIKDIKDWVEEFPHSRLREPMSVEIDPEYGPTWFKNYKRLRSQPEGYREVKSIILRQLNKAEALVKEL